VHPSQRYRYAFEVKRSRASVPARQASIAAVAMA
jgi:hypothetical protein